MTTMSSRLTKDSISDSSMFHKPYMSRSCVRVCDYAFATVLLEISAPAAARPFSCGTST